MKKYFNTTGPCNQQYHYMINLESRLKEIKQMIDRGQYFTINRARQYGKTTLLKSLCNYLNKDYIIISLDFQTLSHTDFESEQAFVSSFSNELLFRSLKIKNIPENIIKNFNKLAKNKNSATLRFLFQSFQLWCNNSGKPIILLIDEVDTASNHQVFLDFLAQLRGNFINRDTIPTFQSVILESIYDVKNLQQKIRPKEEHKVNSPWNIAAPFKIDLNFNSLEISEMLQEYSRDYCIDMNAQEIAQLIYDYTSGYPFLVSRICQIMDEDIQKEKQFLWTKEGFLEAIKLLLLEKNTLFESLVNKIHTYPNLKTMLYLTLFQGKDILYNALNPVIDLGIIFGFLKNSNGKAIIANRIFETLLYNLFLSLEEVQNIKIYNTSFDEKNQFIKNGQLDMQLVLEKFVIHFHDLYGDCSNEFVEEEGRRYFLLYLRPIINGVGNYYIESQTRNLRRTDIIVDYKGEQFAIELKIWHGITYNEGGEKQVLEYLDYYHLKKGYMLSFNFNKKKEIGVKQIRIGERLLIEAVV